MTTIFDQQLLCKSRSTLDGTHQSLYSEFETLPSGQRFRFPRFKCNNNSFVPCAITLFNSAHVIQYVRDCIVVLFILYVQETFLYFLDSPPHSDKLTPGDDFPVSQLSDTWINDSALNG